MDKLLLDIQASCSRSARLGKHILLTLCMACFQLVICAQQEPFIVKLDRAFISGSHIEQDMFGYMWFTDSKGIYKYDGREYRFLDYKTIFGTAFIAEYPSAIRKDNHQNLWFYTTSGELTKLDTNGQYTSFKTRISGNVRNQVTSIAIGHHAVWFGSENGTLYRFNNKTGQFGEVVTMPLVKNRPSSIFSLAAIDDTTIFLTVEDGKILRYELETALLTEENHILAIPNQPISLASDSRRRLWIGSELEGLLCYDIDKKIVLGRFGQIPNSRTVAQFAQFIAIHCDKNDNVWAATDGAGLYKIADFEARVYKHDVNNPFSIGNNTILRITEDRHNNIWIVTKRGQINQIHQNNNHISFFSGLEDNRPLTDYVLSILKSQEGSLWIGTDGMGLNRITPAGKTIQYNTDQNGPHHFDGKYIVKMIEDAKGDIWVATYLNGLWVYQVATSSFKKIKLVDRAGRPISDVRFLFKDSKNRIWVSVANAFYLFSEEQDLITCFEYERHGLFGKISESICEDEQGRVWVGVLDGGLFRFEENQENLANSYFVSREYYSKDANANLNHNIKMMAPDKNGSLWIICTSGMLIKYDFVRDRFESYLKRKLFEGNHFQSIIVQNPDHLWLSTKSGIHHYNLSAGEIKAYHRFDGLINDFFASKSAHTDNKGEFYFGGEYGVSTFNPSKISKVASVPELYVNNIDILNKPGYTIIPAQFNSFVEKITSLDLTYDQSSFAFQFSAIGDILYGNYQYAYRLNGFDKDWVISKERIATYTNIPPGNYIFEVKAGTQSGAWDMKPKSIAINIKPPFWGSRLAYVIYFIVALLISYSISRWLRLKARLEKEAWQNSKEREVYDLKMDFFAKMSHEIQTPLTLILGPVEDMLSYAQRSGNTILKKQLRIIGNNANRLSRIASELMLLRNRELEKLRLRVSENDLIKHLKLITFSFSEQARFKNIDFLQRYPQEDIMISYDREKIEHVVYNLLSNAFKFTPPGGIVTLTVAPNLKDGQVEITVTDSGPGIAEEELNDIFRLFYQTNIGRQNSGNGIGLALTKELVDLHHGEISVSSSPEFGTSFKVCLKMDSSVYAADETVEVGLSGLVFDDHDSYPNRHQLNGLDLDFKEDAQKSYTLLLVEDNVEMQELLGDILRKRYKLVVANNGQEGVAYAEAHVPDLIISDIMMPTMDGYEMCEIIQNKKHIAHIPVIFLTAENSASGKIRGLELGAVEFLRKPFNFNELLLKINNILVSKEKALSRYKLDAISAPQDLPDQTKDAIFLNKLVKELNREVENPDFKLEELANSLNMSYSVIYKKCHEITGKTLVEFSRSMRLKRASLLIVQKKYNVSESAYMVGYKDSKHFTKCFKEEFGVTPATFKKEAEAIGLDELLGKYKIQC